MRDHRFQSALIAIAVCFAVYHFYFVRELTAALLILAVPFATLVLVALSLFILQQAAMQGMNALGAGMARARAVHAADPAHANRAVTLRGKPWN